MTVELIDPAGRITPGRWHPTSEIEIGSSGSDVALPALGELVESAAVVVGHRCARRAVVRLGDTFVKVLRAHRVARPAAKHRAVATALACGSEGPAGGPTTELVLPELLGIDEDRGTLHFAALDGRSALDAQRGDARAARAVGAALRRFAALVPVGVGVHSAADEVAVLDIWAGAARRFGTLPEPLVATFEDLCRQAKAELIALGERPAVLSHRDFHDGQILVDATVGEARIGFIDLDTVAWGDPALDVGNFLAHVDLAVQERRIDPVTAQGFVEGFLAGRALKACEDQAIGAYRRASTLRIVAVHSFRPMTRAAALSLLSELIGAGG